MQSRGIHSKRRRMWVQPLFFASWWILLTMAMLWWANRAEDRHIHELVRLQARTLHTQILNTRSWNSAHGGVYVPESSWSPRNTWLPQAEQSLQAGDMTLVKLNPAYMTRQLSGFATSDARFRLSSLRPTRPANQANDWESEALEYWEAQNSPGQSGVYGGSSSPVEEIFYLTEEESQPFFRYMAPLRAEESCLRCHTQSVENEILGGISVSMYAPPILHEGAGRKQVNTIAFGLLGIIGATAIAGATWQLNKRKLEAEEANQAKNAFLAHLSHDMRTPLAGIQDMLKSMEAAQPQQAPQLAYVRKSAESLLGTVEGLLSHSLHNDFGQKWQNAQFSPRSSIESCLAAVRPACQNKGLHIECSFDSRIPEFLEGDAYSFRQIVGNLLSNAAKFSTSGTIKVDVSSRSVQESPNCFLVIRVKDSGPGIPPEQAESIFDPFNRAADAGNEENGYGLGLAIARQLARGMGGDVRLEPSEKGSLFVFTVEFPRADMDS